VRVIAFEVNLGVNRLTKISPTAERLFEGRATMIIDGSRHRFRIALPRPPAKRASLNTVRLQNGDDIGQVDCGRLEPGGQLVLALKRTEQAATKADVAGLIDRLCRVEEILTTRR